MRKIFISLALVGVMFSQTGCFGEFALTRKLYDWNSNVGGKFVNNLIFWAFSIIPVYGVAGFIDFVILNTIEFWSGSNPMAMEPGQIEEQYATVDGRQFKMTAQHNLFTVEELTANGYELRNEFKFNADTKELSISNGEVTQVFAAN